MSKLNEYLEKINAENLPKHVAIIMDGNGRWAKDRGLPRIAGHRAGVESIKRVAEISQHIGIHVLTFFAFSTENWKRPKKEVEFLMSLPQEYLKRELDNLKRNNIRITVVGDIHSIPPKTREVIEKGVKETENNTSLRLNFALNYGGRKDIIDAVKQAIHEHEDPEQITEEQFENYLYTRDLPDPDLLIRSSGEQRLSNFMLWQLAYTELWFSRAYWPDFKKEDLLSAVLDYQKRNRRFGTIKT